MSAYPTKSRPWHFLLPISGATTVPEYYRFCEFRVGQQSYLYVLDHIKHCMTELQPISLSWRVFKMTSNFAASLRSRPLLRSYKLCLDLNKKNVCSRSDQHSGRSSLKYEAWKWPKYQNTGKTAYSIQNSGLPVWVRAGVWGWYITLTTFISVDESVWWGSPINWK